VAGGPFVPVLSLVLQREPLTDLGARLNLDLRFRQNRGPRIRAMLLMAWIGRRLLRLATSRLRRIADPRRTLHPGSTADVIAALAGRSAAPE
jgi:hypothetical protein